MRPLKKTTTSKPLSPTTTNHILWGIVCFGLLLFAVAMWQNIQSLTNQNNTLQREVASLKARHAPCTARDTWQPDSVKNFQALTPDGARSYSVYLPKDFDANTFYPLIVHFPGKGATAIGGANQAKLDSLPAIIAYPHPTTGTDGYTAWQGAPYSSGADDISFTVEMLDKIESQLCIDRKRVYTTGMSNGGGMVALLSCRLSDRFAAFGIVAGAMYYPAASCSPPRPTPIISIHGDKDPTVPYQGSALRKLPSVTTWAAERAKDNGCSTRPAVTNPDTVTTVTTWKDCKDNASVESIKLHGFGHLWWPEAPQTLWRFMSAHTL